MIEVITALLLIVGSFFMVVAALGIIRMPDLLLRMSCSTKAGTISLGALLLALAIYFWEFGIAARAAATICFVLLTAPIASHRIGRIAYLVRVPLWRGTIKDELQDVYPPDACSPFGQVCVIPSMDGAETGLEERE